jgi:dinuclear metal center YbgI/SA1388 family protein
LGRTGAMVAPIGLGCMSLSGVYGDADDAASVKLVHAAIEQGADAIIVHHGYFWRGEEAAITGPKRRRLKTLLDADVSLLAYHLPLDAHSELGNNIQLARVLGLTPTGELMRQNNQVMGLVCDLSEQISAQTLKQRIGLSLNRQPLHIDCGESLISRVALCTGAAQQYIEQAAAAGADVYISGEISEQTVHSAREHGLHYFAAGHHATERYGIKALGDWAAQRFNIQHTFIDIDNPV